MNSTTIANQQQDDDAAASHHLHHHLHQQQQLQEEPPSQASTSSYVQRHHPLESVSGRTLFEQEARRRDALRARGNCATGSRELDEACLAGGGFERGCVVGVSAEGHGGDGAGEGEDVGLVMGLQTIGEMFAEAEKERKEKKGEGEGRRPRAMIISTMAVGALIGVLREVAGAQIACGSGDGGSGEEGSVLRGWLERIDIARVFDVPGLWEVLGELDRLPPSQELGEEEAEEKDEDEEKEEEGRPREVKPEEKAARGAGAKTTTGQGQVDNDNDNGGRERRDGAGEEAHEEDLRLGASPGAGDDQLEPTIDRTESSGRDTGPPEAAEPPSSPLSDPPSSLPDELPWDTTEIGEAGLPRRTTPPGQRQVIQDSEDEEGFSSPVAPAETSPETSPMRIQKHVTDDRPLSPVAPGDGPSWGELTPAEAVEPGLESQPEFDTAEQTHEQDEPAPSNTPSARAAAEFLAEATPVAAHQPAHQSAPDQPASRDEPTRPDIILVTHMSALLSSLWNQRERATAHETVQLLASHLRYIARAPEHGGPLIMLLNSTTSPPDATITTTANNNNNNSIPAATAPARSRPLDPTLRSIFHPTPPAPGLAYAGGGGHNKPSFGLVFTQMLDLHLLCTRVPKTRADAEVLYAPPAAVEAAARATVGYAWAVEVLLDEVGVWEGRGGAGAGPRRSREQRWGAVEVRRDTRGVRVVDAFKRGRMGEGRGEKAEARVAVAGGFGGRRV